MHAPLRSERCRPCERQYTEQTLWLQKAADGHIYTQIGRPMTIVTALVFLIPPLLAVGWNLAGLLGVIIGAASGTVATAVWYARTPPRQAGAIRMLRKRRTRFLAKRAKRLPELPPAPATD